MEDETYRRWKQDIERIFLTGGVEPALSFVRGAGLADDDWRIRLEEADLHVTADRFQEAIDLLRPLVEVHPDEPELHYRLGETLFCRGAPDEAIPHLERAAQDTRWAKDARILLARIPESRGDPSTTRVRLTDLLHIYPGDPDVLTCLALVTEALGNPEEAIELARAAVREHPDHGGLRGALGVVLCSVGRAKEAVEHLSLAVQRRPKNTSWIEAAAEAYVRSGDVTAAVKLLKEAIVRFPKDALLHLRLGLCSAMVGNIADLLRHGLISNQLAPEIGDTWAAIALAQASLGFRDDAVKRLHEALERGPISPGLLQMLAARGVTP